MTYLEIIEWLQYHAESFSEHMLGNYRLSYLNDEGYTTYALGKDLISIVLEINKKQLIK